MLNKHFLKTVIIFTGMIIIGLLGIFLVSHYGNRTADFQAGQNIAK